MPSPIVGSAACAAFGRCRGRRSTRAQLRWLLPARIAASILSLVESVSGYPERVSPDSLPSAAKVQVRFAENRQIFRDELIAPVEVARARPEAVVRLNRLVVVLPGPLEGDRGLRRDGRLGAVHRVLDAGLLLGLEKRMVVERILVHVVLDRKLSVEIGVPFLQLEMSLEHL